MIRSSERSAIEEAVVTTLGAAVAPIDHSSKRLVLTTFPSLWNHRSAASFSEIDREDTPEAFPTIADVKTLLGADDTVRLGGGGYDWRERIAAKLEQAGWPSSRIVHEYRPDLKTARRFDAAILDRSGSPFLVIESAERKDLSALEDVRNQLTRYAQDSEIPWLCFQTSTNSFQLFSAKEPSDIIELDRVPSPADCNEEVARGFERSEEPAVVAPSSLGRLQDVVRERSIEQLLLDPTLPWNDRIQEDAPINDWAEALPGLSEKITELGGSVRHSLDLFLAWGIYESRVQQVGALCPHGYLFKRRHGWIRELSLSRLPPAAIIECGSGVASAHTGVRTALSFFSSEHSQTYFNSLSSRGELLEPDDEDWRSELRQWMAGQELEPQTGFVTELSSASNWTFAANDPQVARTRERLGRLGNLSSLSKHCDVARGSVSPNRVSDVDEQEADEGVLFVGTSEISQGSSWASAGRRVELNASEDVPTAESGDFLISDFLEDGLQLVQYDRSEPAVLSRRVIRLRPIESSVVTGYLTSYLSSPAVERLLRAEVGSFSGDVPRLRVTDLRSLPIPRLEHEFLAEIADIEELEQELIETAERMASERRSLFDARGPDEFQREARRLRERSSLLSAGLQLADDLDYKIRNFYPYPLAFPYHAVSAQTSVRGRYQEQLRFAENVLAFIGALSLALVEPDDRQELSDRVGKEWLAGITPGGWRQLAGAAGDILGRYEDHRLADSISRLQVRSGKRGIGPITQGLVRTKNEYKHDEGPTTDSQFREAEESLSEELEDCMQRLSFLTEFPIRQVVEIDPIRQRDEIGLRCLRYSGDHPGVPTERVEMRTADFARQRINKGDLYVDLGDDHWRSLRPFMLARDCPTCDTREIYFLDKLDISASRAKMKSFERGHTIWDESSICDEVLNWT